MPEPLLEGACWTDRGGRRSNQDATIAVLLEDGRELVAVADGMGGHVGGAVASRLALQALVSGLEDGATLEEAVCAANAAVHAAPASHPEWHGMGTTLVAALRSGNRYEIANVGDSRAYRVDEGGIVQLTRDHSFMAEAQARGGAEANAAASSPWRHAVTRAIGLEPAVEVDIFGPFRVREPGYLLLCSDGLSNALDEPALRRHFLNEPVAAAAVERLGRTALAAGASDNVTAAVMRLSARDGRMARPGAPPLVQRDRPAAAASIWRWRIREAAIVVLGLLLLIVFLLVLKAMS